jgi:adenine deaminase
MAYLDPRLIRVALGQQPADLVIQNGNLLNVLTREILPAGVAIAGTRIAAIGDVGYCVGPSTERIDARGKYLTPGLIDAHVHPEVSKLTINRFAEAAIGRGTTSIMCSLDQVGVVAGVEGMRFVLDAAKRTPLKVFHCGPSRLPYTTPASTVAHSFGPAEHRIAMTWPESVGMWEYMIESIERLEEPVLEIAGELLDSGRLPHGHLPFTNGPRLQAAAAAGARSCHENWLAEEVVSKLRQGLYVFLRKATCIDNFVDCLKAVTEMPQVVTRRIALCSDDVDCTDLVELGYADHFVRHAIELGVDPITAIEMCTINPAEAYRVDDRVGVLAPGRIADVVLVNDLTSFQVDTVIADGRVVVRDAALIAPFETIEYPPLFHGTMRRSRPIDEADIYQTAPADAAQARAVVMHVEPSQIRTRREVVLPVRRGRVLPDPDQDALYVSVTDRHSGETKTASAFIGGFGLQRGAMATSLSPDDDNVICVGASVPDMVVAINHLFDIGGGQVVASGGRVTHELALPVAGIMADIPVAEMADQERAMHQAVQALGADLQRRPFFTLLFLSITAIPEYSVTDQGFVEYSTRSYISPVRSWS